MKMTFLERLQKLERLHHLIRRKGTGSAKELSERLNVCPRTIYQLLNDLRHQGASISYDHKRGSYCYTQETEFHFTPLIKRADEEAFDSEKI
jgi:predicted DNA-binding transcriptional regulator YafY